MTKDIPCAKFDLGTILVTAKAFNALALDGIAPVQALCAHAVLWPAPSMTPRQHADRIAAIAFDLPVVTHLHIPATALTPRAAYLTVVTEADRRLTILMLTSEQA